MLGSLYELPHWRAVQKYLDLSRKQFVDHGFPVAQDLLALGEVKGNLNMCNLIEMDFANFNAEKQERVKAKQMEVAGLSGEEDTAEDS